MDEETKPEYRCGTGYGDNKDTSTYIDQLIEKGVINEKGGIMKPGAWLKIGSDNKNVAKMTVDQVKAYLSEHKISF